MIKRSKLLNTIKNSLENFPITAILGPRQCGKTTISRVVAESIQASIFDLEDPVDLERLTVAPKLTLEQLSGLIIIDEIQRLPGLFPILRVLADRTNKNTRFLILGSASPELVKKASESLSGRISYIDMSGFSVNEISNEKDLWLRGGFPRSFLAKEESILTRALKEAERQKIDAEGKATANKILSASLTDKILQEKGIQATLEMARSPNTKVIVIGDKNGMPLILGNQ